MQYIYCYIINKQLNFVVLFIYAINLVQVQEDTFQMSKLITEKFTLLT